jgi:hypothetical protein
VPLKACARLQDRPACCAPAAKTAASTPAIWMSHELSADLPFTRIYSVAGIGGAPPGHHSLIKAGVSREAGMARTHAAAARNPAAPA